MSCRCSLLGNLFGYGCMSGNLRFWNLKFCIYITLAETGRAAPAWFGIHHSGMKSDARSEHS